MVLADGPHMDVVLLGSTGHVGYVLDGLEEVSDVRISGVAAGSGRETVDDLLETVRDRDPDAERFADPAAALATDPDLAVVACHFGDLARWSRAALERDVHVYTEKPVATTLEDLAAVQRAHAASGGELTAMFGYRYDDAFYTAWRRVDAGAIGDVRLLFAQKSYKLGERPAFYHERERHGGLIPWVGIHAIDWLQWFADREVDSIAAAHSRRANRDHDDLEVTAVTNLTFEDEVIGAATMDYLRPAAAPTHGDDRLRVVGTDGVIEVRDGSAWLVNADHDGTEPLELGDGGNPFADFVASIRSSTTPRVTAADAFRATETALRARNTADELMD